MKKMTVNCLPIVIAGAVLAGCGASPGLQAQGGGSAHERSLPPVAAALVSSSCADGRHRHRRRAMPLGLAAYVQGGALKLAVLARCRTQAQTLVAHGVRAPVRFSADGRWVAYGRGTVVGLRRREIVRPLGQQGIFAWAWVGGGDELVGVTDGGGLVSGAPGAPTRQLLPDGWGTTSVATAPDGEIAVTRTPPRPGGHVAGSASIWTLTLSHPRPVLAYRAPGGTAELQLARFAPGGKDVVFWVNRWGSASLAESGLPLQLAPLRRGGPAAALVTLSTASPVEGAAVAVCGARLVFVAGGGRETRRRERLQSASAAGGWRAHALTGAGHHGTIAPACSPSGRLLAAAAAGTNRQWRAGAGGWGESISVTERVPAGRR